MVSKDDTAGGNAVGTRDTSRDWWAAWCLMWAAIGRHSLLRDLDVVVQVGAGFVGCPQELGAKISATARAQRDRRRADWQAEPRRLRAGHDAGNRRRGHGRAHGRPARRDRAARRAGMTIRWRTLGGEG